MIKKKSAKICPNHPDTHAVLYCKVCKRFFCQDCAARHSIVSGIFHETAPAETVSDFDFLGGKCPEHTSFSLDSFCNDCFGNIETTYSIIYY